MRHTLYYIGALVLAIIPYSSVLGEPITHNFNDMFTASPKRLVLAPGNTSATTADDFTYTCADSGTATSKFGMDLYHELGSQVISVNLKSENDYVVVTSADALGYVSLFFYPENLTYEKLKIYASADGADYGDALEVNYYSGRVVADNLPAGSHYLKISNEGSTALSIYQMEYRIENCNCFRYVPE